MIVFKYILFIFCVLFFKTSFCAENHVNNQPCGYNFHVWNPGQDVIQRIRDVNHKVENMTGHIDREFLKLKANMLEELKQCQNWTINLERDVMNLKFKSLKGRITERDTSDTIIDVEKEILDLKKKVSHIKHNFKNIQNSIHPSKLENLRSMETFNQHDKELLEKLKNLVRDLKAEWVVIKREVINLQAEHMEMKIGQNVHSNESFFLSKSFNSLRLKVLELEEENKDWSKTLQSQSTKQGEISDKLKILEQAIKDSDGDDIEDDVKFLEDKITLLEINFGLLKDDNVYLKKLVLASLKTAGVQKDGQVKPKPEFTGVPKDCQDIMDMGNSVSGVYQIKPIGAYDMDNIYCEIVNETAYTVMQRRTDGLLSFNRQWIEYKYGFGNLYGSHWVGNEWIHFLTHQDDYTLRIDMWDWEGKKHFAEYTKFKVGDRDDDYRLHVGGYSGNAGDSLSNHDGMKFSTEDMDNDLHIKHCASENKSGWWFNNCYLSNLNGVFHVGYYSHNQYGDGIVWYTLKEDEFYSLRKVEMKLRRNT